MRIVLIMFIVLTVFTASNSYCQDPADDITPMLESAKKGVTDALNSIDKDLDAAVSKLSKVDFKKEEARGILRELCDARPYVIYCAIVDPKGKIIVAEPLEYKKYEGMDISWQAHIIALLQVRRPIFSMTIQTKDGTNAIDFEYPMFAGARYLGSLSMVIRHNQLFDSIISPIVKDKHCKIWIMEIDGLVVYDPDPNQIGKNIFTDELYKPFTGLVEFSKRVAAEEKGVGFYEFYSKGLEDKTVVKKDAAWDTAGMHSVEWRIVTMEIESEV